MAQRLPIPGSDDGTWGDILNNFIQVEHNSDGTLKIRSDGTVAPLSSGKVPASNLGSGTANSTSYLRGDGTWSVPAGGVTLDPTDTDIQPLGTRTAGATGQAADAGHVHAMPRLDQILIPTAAISMNTLKITNIANGTVATDAAAFGQIPVALPPNGTAGGSLAGSYPNPTISNGAITATEVAAANKDGLAATPSLRTLGGGAQQAAAGNDVRLSDTRIPTDGSVTDAKVAAGAAIAVNKLAPSGTDGRILTTVSGVAAWAAAAGSSDSNESVITNASSGATPVLDMGVSSVHDLTLTATATVTFTGASAGRAYSLLLILRQDATGNRLMTWPASVKWPLGIAPTLSTTGNAVDMLSFVTVDGGTTWFGTLSESNFQ